MKARIDNFVVTASGNDYVAVTFLDDTNEFVESAFIPTDFCECSSPEMIFEQAKTDVLVYAVSKSYEIPSVFGMFATIDGIPGLPKTAVANVAGDATTNQVGETLNALLAELRSAGIIAT